MLELLETEGADSELFLMAGLLDMMDRQKSDQESLPAGEKSRTPPNISEEFQKAFDTL